MGLAKFSSWKAGDDLTDGLEVAIFGPEIFSRLIFSEFKMTQIVSNKFYYFPKYRIIFSN